MGGEIRVDESGDIADKRRRITLTVNDASVAPPFVSSLTGFRSHPFFVSTDILSLWGQNRSSNAGKHCSMRNATDSG
jgi:hypothetical protein